MISVGTARALTMSFWAKLFSRRAIINQDSFGTLPRRSCGYVAQFKFSSSFPRTGFGSFKA